MTASNPEISGLLSKILDDVLGELSLSEQDTMFFREVVFTKAELDPYLLSKLQRILDLSASS